MSFASLFFEHDGLPCDRWHHYFEVYDRHLARYRQRPVRMLEIGVQRGGSLQLWRKYLGEQAIIHGLDIDPACAKLRELGLNVHIGDQGNAYTLRHIVEEMGGIDVVIDDGGHINPDQITALKALYPLLSDDGVYICEDVHTSYWPTHGGGLEHPGSFIEYSKKLIDRLHAWYMKGHDQSFAASTRGVFFYDSMVVIEKCRRSPPRRSVVGAEHG